MIKLRYVYVCMTSWYGGINSYFGSLVLWQILSTNNETMSILYRPNEVQKLDVGLSLEAVFVHNKKAVLPQGNRAMPQVFFSVEVRQQHSLQV